MSKSLSFTLIVIALIIGMGLGFTITPEYAAMKEEKSAMPELGAADRNLDRRYLEGVIAHHLTAIDLAKQALDKSHRDQIRSLSEEIIKTDEASIKELYAFRKSWYNNDRTISEFTRINLGENDGKFDLRFLNALIAHHEEAIEVAKEVRTKSTRTEVLNLADTIITNLSAGKDTLLSWRQDWYQI